MREEFIGYGAEALVVKEDRRLMSWQISRRRWKSGETARTLARRDQAHALRLGLALKRSWKKVNGHHDFSGRPRVMPSGEVPSASGDLHRRA